jgi:type II secretory pathway component PulL
LQGEFAPRGDERTWSARLRRPAALALALLGLWSCGIALDWTAKARERRALFAEMNAIYRQTFGEKAVAVDAPLQMQRAVAEQRRNGGEAGPADFLTLLPLATERVLDPALGRVRSIRYGQGRLVAEVEPHQAGQLAPLLEALRRKSAIPGFEARVETIETPGAARVRLTLHPEGGRWALARP